MLLLSSCLKSGSQCQLPFSTPTPLSQKKKKKKSCVFFFSGMKEYAIFSAYELLLLESNQLLIVWDLINKAKCK